MFITWLQKKTQKDLLNSILSLFAGCPRLVRADRGCENSLVAVMQMSFRYRHNDSLAGVKSFKYGKSVHNQVNNNFFFHNLNVVLYFIIVVNSKFINQPHDTHTNKTPFVTLTIYVLGLIISEIIFQYR